MKTCDMNARTRDFAVEILSFAESLPRRNSVRIVESQLIKAATSVGANFREASRAQSRRDFIHKIGVAAKECAETQYWLEVISEAGMGNQDDLAPVVRECSEILAILVTIGRNVSNAPPPKPQ
jgi:four helix bundle protein